PSIALANTFTQNKLIETDSITTEFIISNATPDTANDGCLLGFRRSDGTHASPTVVKQGMHLGRINFSGYDDFAFKQSSVIVCTATADFDAFKAPSNSRIKSSGDGGLIVSHDGGVTVVSPTGGSQGAGTLNATGVYDDGSLLTCYP